jgi:DNA-binding response OmpR family regulator
MYKIKNVSMRIRLYNSYTNAIRRLHTLRQMPVKKILLVEDDAKLSKLVIEYLTKQGLSVNWEPRGDKAIYRILHEDYFLVILDINLPGIDGLQVCKTVRNDYSGFILMLTARAADEDHITGLEYGADDYINKPIHPKVLLARINNLTRRDKLSAASITKLTFGKLIIDLKNRVVKLNSTAIDLKPTEFDILALLALNAGKSLTRDSIMRTLRGVDYDGVDRTIDLRISYLRKKLRDNIKNPYRIKTIRNKGYILLPDAWS